MIEAAQNVIRDGLATKGLRHLMIDVQERSVRQAHNSIFSSQDVLANEIFYQRVLRFVKALNPYIPTDTVLLSSKGHHDLPAEVKSCLDENPYSRTYCKKTKSLLAVREKMHADETPGQFLSDYQDCGTVIVSGLYTTDCHMKTVLDLARYGFDVLVPVDCVFHPYIDHSKKVLNKGPEPMSVNYSFEPDLAGKAYEWLRRFCDAYEEGWRHYGGSSPDGAREFVSAPRIRSSFVKQTQPDIKNEFVSRIHAVRSSDIILEMINHFRPDDYHGFIQESPSGTDAHGSASRQSPRPRSPGTGPAR